MEPVSRAKVPVRFRPATFAVATGVVASVTLAGCSAGTIGHLTVHAGVQAQKSMAVISVSPTPSHTATPNKPVVVRATVGRLTDVVVAGPNGAAVPGQLSADARTWTSQSGVLNFATTYRVQAVAVDGHGLPTSLATSVREAAAGHFISLSMTPNHGDQVGVGMPVTLSLDHPMSNPNARRAFEQTLTVTANKAPVNGAWAWQNDTTLEYRPMTYWPGHAAIAVTAALKGVPLGSGVWGGADETHTFTTGPAMISFVNIKTDKLTVTRDGKIIRVIPVTTGKAGFETRSGVKVIMTKEYSRVMDAATGGTAKNSPDYYKIEVFYAMRLTDSGEFLHAAPWSEWAQGTENVSHGCTGMSTSNAQWLYDQSEIGDVVEFTGTTRMMTDDNGLTVWNVSFNQWRKGSALTV